MIVVDAGLGDSAVRGGAITVITQLARVFLQVVGLIALSRLLPPEDVGIMAMVLIVTGFGEVIRDFGLSIASVQATHVTTVERSTLFWMNAGLGVLAASVAFAVAPLVAGGLDEPRLTAVIRVVSVCLILNALGAQYQADLNRELRFAALGWSEVASAAIALLVAVTAAAAGADYWALAIQQVVLAAILLPTRAVLAGWMPNRPRRRQDIRRFVSYSFPLFGTHVLAVVTQNADTVVIGRQSGAAALGPYSRAFQLLTLPVQQLSTPLLRVTLPVLSRVRDDWDKFHDYLLQGQLVLGYSIVALLGLTAAMADPLFVLLLGDEWAGVATPFRLLAVGGCFQSMSFVCYWIFLSKALTKELLRYSLVSRAIGIAMIVAGSHWGTAGVASGVTGGLIIGWPLSIWWLRRHGAMSARALVGNGLRVLLAGLIPALAGLWAGSLFSSELSRLAATAAGWALAVLLLLATPMYRADFRVLIAIMTRLRSLSRIEVE